ncbi:hypothetical protein IFM89_013371 [Coptis chinensis]|uniref:Myb/SANT-like domain-containing protein n=1 Tax=Coptis chinensis TaxID=261450 RepID=A0A835I3T4_9MAGN|nr:hypothetical protein IFM89_013371 [Coptis chinensis]
MVTRELNQILNLSVRDDNVCSRMKTLKRDYITVKELLESTEFGFSYNQQTKCIDVDRQAWDAYFRAYPVARHLRGRMFPYFAEACVIFGNDYSYHTLNVCESFGPVVTDTPQVASVLGENFGDTQVESVESVSGLGVWRWFSYWCVKCRLQRVAGVLMCVPRCAAVCEVCAAAVRSVGCAVLLVCAVCEVWAADVWCVVLLVQMCVAGGGAGGWAASV